MCVHVVKITQIHNIGLQCMILNATSLKSYFLGMWGRSTKILKYMDDDVGLHMVCKSKNCKTSINSF